MIDLDAIEVKGPWAVRLKISTFMGFSVEAEHWYAKLEVCSKHVNYMSAKRGTVSSISSTSLYTPENIDVQYELTARQAALLNKKEHDHRFRDFEKGQLTGRFFDKKDIAGPAVETFKVNFSDKDFLYLGDTLYRDKEIVGISGPDVEIFNALTNKEKRDWIRDKYETIDMTHLGPTETKW